MPQINTLDLAREIVKQIRQGDTANILLGNAGDFRPVGNVALNLTTALTRNQSIQMSAAKYIWVSKASDRSAYVYVVLQNLDDSVKEIKMSQSENQTIELSEAVKGFYIFWDAQSGKTLELTYSPFVKTSGKNVDTQSVLSDGSSRSLITPVTIPATGSTPVAILPQDSDRIYAELELAIDSDIVLLNSATATVANGVTRLAGERWSDRNKGVLYAVSKTATPVNVNAIVYK